MANEFPSALRKAAGNRVEEGFIERTGDFDAESAVRRGKAFAVDGDAEFAGEGTQDADFGEASPQIRTSQQFAGTQGQPWAKGIAQGIYTAAGRGAEQRAQH